MKEELDILDKMALTIKVVTEINKLRHNKGIPFKEKLNVIPYLTDIESFLPYSSNGLLEDYDVISVDIKNVFFKAIIIYPERTTIYSENNIDTKINKINKQLSNENFIKNAKSEIVNNEYKKKNGTQNKIDILRDSLGII